MDETARARGEAWLEKANASHLGGRLEEAVAGYREALALLPDLPVVHYNLGVTLRDLERNDEARACFERVLELRRDSAPAHNNLGLLAARAQDTDRAIFHYRKAIALEWHFPDAHHNLAMALLQKGDYAEGWEEYEWRWKTSQFQPFACAQPRWDGEELDGTLMVHTEQGAGDIIQFARLLPLAAQRCRRLLVVGPAFVHGLLSRLPGVAEVCEPELLAADDFQAWASLLDLPQLLGITLDNLPADIPYVTPPATGPALPPAGGKQKAGIVWAGSPTQGNDRHRSCPLAALLPLATLADTQLYSLQKGAAEAQLVAAGAAGAGIIDLAPLIRDYDGTLFLVQQLDRVIGVDTSVVHVAGALGKPVDVLLCARADWRWLGDRDDSPWYPGMRLFRQRQAGDWAEVVQRVMTA